MSAPVTEQQARRAGVWDAPDAPDGYVALVVYSCTGRRLMRVEIAQDVYSLAWVQWLERWLRLRDRGFIQLVKS